MYNLFFTFQSIVPVRAQASDAAEMVTQLLFGDVVECMARDRQWMQVRIGEEGYPGWIDEKAVLGIDATWLDAVDEWRYVVEDHCTVQTRRAGASLPTRLSLGMRLPSRDGGRRIEIDGWEADGSHCATKPDRQEGVDFVLQMSERYLGTPYLWGGKTLAGIDCSGLTQMVYAMAGIALPRDARDQIGAGTAVEFDSRVAGDLAFFENASGKVHHVGIVLPDGNIRHASGHVHDAVLNRDGILGKYTGQQTHRLVSIKRII